MRSTGVYASRQKSGLGPFVFVSHSDRDTEWCNAFVGRLQSVGVIVWYDKQGIRHGDLWVRDIERQIGASDVFIIVLTPEAWESTWVQRELDLALALHKPILGIIHKQTGISGFIITHQFLDATALSPEEAASAANASIREMAVAALERARGVAVPAGSIPPSPVHKEMAMRLLTFLEDRRVLFNATELDRPQLAISSVLKIRERFVADLEALVDRSSRLANAIEKMNAACRTFLDVAQSLRHLPAEFDAEAAHCALSDSFDYQLGRVLLNKMSGRRYDIPADAPDHVYATGWRSALPDRAAWQDAAVFLRAVIAMRKEFYLRMLDILKEYQIDAATYPYLAGQMADYRDRKWFTSYPPGERRQLTEE